VARSLPRYAMLAVLLAAASIVVGCGHGTVTPPPSPSGSSVSVELKAAQPTYPAGTTPQISMVLHNNGSRSCALPSVADGAVDVVSVTRNGTAVVGRPGREDLFGGMAAVVALGLRSVDAESKDSCQPIGPLALNPGAYDVQIDAQSTDADYQFAARSS
jgi:hypothetical protein